MLGLWPEGDHPCSPCNRFQNLFLPTDKLQRDSTAIPPITTQEINGGEQQTVRKERMSDSDPENQKENTDNDHEEETVGSQCGGF